MSDIYSVMKRKHSLGKVSNLSSLMQSNSSAEVGNRVAYMINVYPLKEGGKWQINSGGSIFVELILGI